MGYILSIDQGTTGTTSALIDLDSLELVGKINKEFPQIFPKPGWVEHDLNEIWSTVAATVTEVLTKTGVDQSEVKSIGITNQRETICAFNKEGRPLRNAIVWQDRRTHQYCKDLDENTAESIKKKTGLPVDPYFSGTKINWLIENDSDVQKAIEKQDCLFGTIDTFLIYKLTGGTSFATEASNASRTLLYDLKKDDWCSKLLGHFKVEREQLPKILSSFGTFGKTKGLSFLPDNIEINGVLGDQQAALFGQAGIEKGMSKCTYGTGAFYLLNTGKEVVASPNGLLTTVAYKEGDDVYYALEGSCYIAGAAVQWLRDQLQIIPSSPDIENLAKKAGEDQMENILFLPFFTGLGSPYWVANSQAAIVGLTRDTGKAEVARACLEGICLSINDLIESMEKDSGLKVKELRVDGGAVVNDYLMQLQSNFSETTIVRPQVIETTAFGAACAAAIGAGFYKKEQIAEKWREDKSFTPETHEYFNHKKEQWKTTIQRLYLN